MKFQLQAAVEIDPQMRLSGFTPIGGPAPPPATTPAATPMRRGCHSVAIEALHEPPNTETYVRWCGRRGPRGPLLPDCVQGGPSLGLPLILPLFVARFRVRSRQIASRGARVDRPICWGFRRIPEKKLVPRGGIEPPTPPLPKAFSTPNIVDHSACYDAASLDCADFVLGSASIVARKWSVLTCV